MKHTPGPWHISDDPFPNAIDSEHKHVAMVNDLDPEECKANLRLIVKCPEVLEAARRFVDDFTLMWKRSELRGIPESFYVLRKLINEGEET